MKRDNQGRFIKGEKRKDLIGNDFRKGEIPWNKNKRAYEFECANTECKKKFRTSEKRRRFCSKECARKKVVWNKGMKMPLRLWENAKSLQHNCGYLMRSIGNKLILEQDYIYCRENKLDRITKGYVVHHINGIKTDNRIENLQLMTRKEHMNIHRKTTTGEITF